MNAEQTVVAYLKTVPGLSGAGIGFTLPEGASPSGGTYVTVERSGGSTRNRVDTAQLTVMVWAPTPWTASDTMHRVLAPALRSMADESYDVGMSRVDGIVEDSYPSDPVWPRWTAQLTMTCVLS